MTRRKQPFLRKLGQVILVRCPATPRSAACIICRCQSPSLPSIVVPACFGFVAAKRKRHSVRVFRQPDIARLYGDTGFAAGGRAALLLLIWSRAKKKCVTVLARPLLYVHHFGGAGDFNPLVVFFQPLRLARECFVSESAFKDWKQGYKEPVETPPGSCLRAFKPFKQNGS